MIVTDRIQVFLGTRRLCLLRYLLLLQLCIVLQLSTTETCSPPRSKYGEYSIEKVSLLKRTEKAKIIVIGTVISLHVDRFRRSVSAKVAVHMKLKGPRTPHYIDIHGFGGNINGYGPKLNTASHIDCVDSSVSLYGSYLFLVNTNPYGRYYVDEIDFHPGIKDISCRKHISKRIQAVIKKYRRLRKNKVQCNDLEKGTSTFRRQCLRTKLLSKYLSEFTHENLKPRQTFCTLEKLKSQFPRPSSSNELMKDDPSSYVNINLHNNKRHESNAKTHKNTLKWRQWLENQQDIANQRHSQFVVYQKREKFIIQHGSSGENQNKEFQSKSWRLIDNLTTNRSSGTKVTYFSANIILSSFLLLLFVMDIL